MEALECYHTTANENISSILKNGFEPSKTDEEHWLGEGVYFFENLYYAVEWGIIGVIKKKVKDYEKLQNKCGILISNIDVKNYTILDLSSPIGYYIFDNMLNVIEKYYSQKKYEEIKDKGYKYIIQILENLEKIQSEKYLSKYDILCAIYPKNIYKKESNNKSGDFIVCAQKQICVKNRDAILKTEVYENDNIKDVFSLIVNNREEYYERKHKVIK